jgi:hypothetical protein
MQKSLIPSVLLCGLALLLSACGGSKPIEIFSKPVERARLNLEYPAAVTLESPRWTVVTPQNSVDVFKKLSTETETAALYGLTNEQYMQLATTMANIRQHIILQREIIKKYKEYYEPEHTEPSKP